MHPFPLISCVPNEQITGMHLTGIAEHVWTLWAWETVFCTVNGIQTLPLNSEGKGELKFVYLLNIYLLLIM